MTRLESEYVGAIFATGARGFERRRTARVCARHPPPLALLQRKLSFAFGKSRWLAVSLIFVHPSVSFPFVVSGVSCLVYRNTVVWESLMEIM